MHDEKNFQHRDDGRVSETGKDAVRGNEAKGRADDQSGNRDIVGPKAIARECRHQTRQQDNDQDLAQGHAGKSSLQFSEGRQ